MSGAMIITRVWIAFVAGVVAMVGVARAQSCEALSATGSSTVRISMAKLVPAGTALSEVHAAATTTLPAFCRVIASLHPTDDSDIGVEVWLPVVGWNGKFMAVGSGGWGGSIAYDALAEGLQRGYAVSATDDGHRGSSAQFLLGHPQKFIDFAYRSEHEMTVVAKSLVHAFYGVAPKYSYWNGCSGGGREGLIQAARYPEEFDGIVAGDPADMRRNAWALWIANETFKDPQAYIPATKYAMLHRAVLNACDANDGLKDGLIENPETCKVDFKKLQCKGEDRADCLTEKQVHSAGIMISPASDGKGTIYFPRLEPGTEMRWSRLSDGKEPAELFWDQFRYVVYQDPSWDWKSFDLIRDAAKANRANKAIDALDPDLSAFAKRNGKLLLYHGWADQQVAPMSTVEFYQATLAANGDDGKHQDWVRLFMAPGMAHCSGGEGPDRFDKIELMELWVEKGKAPSEVLASHQTKGQVDRTRPLCAYPLIAKYKGKGSIDTASNFACMPE